MAIWHQIKAFLLHLYDNATFFLYHVSLLGPAVAAWWLGDVELAWPLIFVAVVVAIVSSFTMLPSYVPLSRRLGFPMSVSASPAEKG